MRFRTAANEEGALVRELVFTILREFDFTPDPDGVDADLFDIEKSYLRRGGAFELLVDDDNHVIGTVGLYPRSDTVCELRKMYLERKHRGKGLGRMMLEHAVATAWKLGFRRIELETESRLEEAIRLYRSFGFRPIAGKTCCRCDHAFALDLASRLEAGGAP